MLYLANPCGPRVLDAMRAGSIGLIDQPNQGKVPQCDEARGAGVTWCADNGAFSAKWDQAKWWDFLERNAAHAGTCLFAVAPDVVGEIARSDGFLAGRAVSL